jgi:hypothetical protein
MKRLMQYWLILLLVAGACNRAKQGRMEINPRSGTLESNGVQYTIETVRECRYPANDPLYEKRRDKKLLLLQMKVHCTVVHDNTLLIPSGAVLTDKQANNYETSPVVIAMAQNNQCIAGNDIKDYNAIWNGEIKAGETYTAFALGFELPENAVPDKLYWNNGWINQNIFFLLSDRRFTANQ